ncbi:MAG: (d)CMP kinase, partial [Micrococcales bacterium]|nr:(d)CMP kinase [Micrococcales bacterium]
AARLSRRGAQLGSSQSKEALAAQVTGRDAKDSKLVNFTDAADGVTHLDSSELSIEQTVTAVMDLVLRAVPELA